MSSWFEKLMGFPEESPEQVRANITVMGNELISNVNGKRFVHGTLETPSLSELRERVRSEYREQNDSRNNNDDDKMMTCSSSSRRTTGVNNKTIVREVVADVQDLHIDPNNIGAMFQVASQFNLLEMTSPNVIPESGVGIYEHDHTQGPACAIACGAGTIYRNYFAPVNITTTTTSTNNNSYDNNHHQIGQSKTNQIDCLADLGKALGNNDGHLWKMKNGYCLAKTSGLKEISNRLKAARDDELNNLRGLLRIGIMWNTQVTLLSVDDDGAPLKQQQHYVTQAYASALPIAYSVLQSHSQWEDFAKLILESAYEATMCVAILNNMKRKATTGEGSNKVFLTLLGGGAFGNKIDWVISAMKRSIQLYSSYGLDVSIVSYGRSDDNVQKLIDDLTE